MSAQTIAKIRLDLPETLAAEYEKQAATAGKDLETYLVQRLAECKDMDSHGGRSLKLSPEERRRVESLAGRGFKTGAEVVSYLEFTASLKIGGTTVPLSTDLLTRLQSRCIRQEFAPFLAERIVRELEHYVGMR